MVFEEWYFVSLLSKLRLVDGRFEFFNTKFFLRKDHTISSLFTCCHVAQMFKCDENEIMMAPKKSIIKHVQSLVK